MNMLVVTKSLRGYYKNPDQIAHKVLADRMDVRDPGNKPASNDRIPYAYIEVKESKNVKVLQCDRIEHPDFIKENNLKPDSLDSWPCRHIECWHQRRTYDKRLVLSSGF